MKLLALISIMFLTSFAYASTVQPVKIADISTFNNWIPVIIIATMASVAIAIMYYVAGLILNNSRVKTNGLNEIGQAVGTVVIMFIVIWIFYFVGRTGFTSAAAISPSNMLMMCNQLTGSPFYFISNNAFQTNSGSPYYATPTNTICNKIILPEVKHKGSITTNMDYGLAATYLIEANLTNQTIINVNAIYMLDSYTYFLNKLNLGASACLPEITCLQPQEAGTNEFDFMVVLNYTPFAGYTIFRGALGPIAIQSNLILYMYLLSMMATIIFLNFWPFILAAGMILRASFMTRRLGGLLIAIVISFMIIYPVVYLFEYTTLSNTHVSPIGTNSIPNLALVGNVIGSQQACYQSCSSVSGCSSSDPYIYEANCGSIDNVKYLQSLPTSGSCYLSCNVNQEVYGKCKAQQTQSQGGRFSGPIPDYVYRTNCGSSNGEQFIYGQLPEREVVYGTNSIDFFVLPRADWIINHYSCWPGSLLGTELATAGSYLVPGLGLFQNIENLFGAFAGFPSVAGVSCTPQNIVDTVLAMVHLYGLLTIVGVILPILNILIVLTSLNGISTLMGGDANLFGLGRLL
jgi:hypothetical protein